MSSLLALNRHANLMSAKVGCAAKVQNGTAASAAERERAKIAGRCNLFLSAIFWKTVFDEVAAAKARIVCDLAHSKIRHRECCQQVICLELSLGQYEPLQVALKLVNEHRNAWKR